jgi:hypothetical protein
LESTEILEISTQVQLQEQEEKSFQTCKQERNGCRCGRKIREKEAMLSLSFEARANVHYCMSK